MRIVIDTNVIISGIFFSGRPQQIVEAIVEGHFEVHATTEIVDEYSEIVEEMVERKQGAPDHSLFIRLLERIKLIEPKTKVEICRDPDDDKFISCAIDARALYIVSGDKDLLEIESYEGVEIIAAAEFCRRYLS